VTGSRLGRRRRRGHTHKYTMI